MTKRIISNANLCTGCDLCATICSISHQGVANPKSGGIRIWRDLFQRYEGQLVCRQCEDPNCVEACISGAMTLDAAKNIVVHDPEICIGCWMCITACPYNSISACAVNSKGQRVASKCDLCPEEESPLCVMVCPTEALKLEIDDE